MALEIAAGAIPERFCRGPEEGAEVHDVAAPGVSLRSESM